MAHNTDENDWTKAFADNTDRFPDDILLRSYGFQIYSRKKKKPVVWQAPDKSLVNHAEAMREVKAGRWKKLI